MKKRTKIEEIAVAGFELADTQLRQVSGGRPAKCWESSASITNPGNPDTAQDYVAD